MYTFFIRKVKILIVFESHNKSFLPATPGCPVWRAWPLAADGAAARRSGLHRQTCPSHRCRGTLPAGWSESPARAVMRWRTDGSPKRQVLVSVGGGVVQFFLCRSPWQSQLRRYINIFDKMYVININGKTHVKNGSTDMRSDIRCPSH